MSIGYWLIIKFSNYLTSAFSYGVRVTIDRPSVASSAYSSSSGFIYNYVQDQKDIDKLISELDSLIETTVKKDSIQNKNIDVYQFDYTLDIKLDTEAEVVVVLSKELDQNLVAIMDGDFFLESVNGKTKSGGELKLLEGSSLSFIKTFSTSGNVKFDKINNPIILLNIFIKFQF